MQPSKKQPKRDKTVRRLRKQLKEYQALAEKLWEAHRVVVMNGSTGWQRHIEPVVYEIRKQQIKDGSACDDAFI